MSHLLQMRGLKLSTQVYSPCNYVSHLLQMRGLKHLNFIDILFDVVASFTDAWIETLMSLF